ncbi:4-hydroxy-tetrahydrodipicolinate reductase [Methanoplanus sp. FWC-SCC4]|uniref:4-hydroxy-tetrahydrodipicolinate reductase n=1 Tax=Methanochimaera problematica TaxID=2609417 RepID=A0AA97FDX5_9EURY|nr:4-hydroxy-tetrahydrodipicolinate reductase [Methanoplanus sp. FWC-SCC4]WOF16253.1 4-hydroxy-tetrahydrodipicolinate reductase [Methanoplanus sp. FWC-SCC4]
MIKVVMCGALGRMGTKIGGLVVDSPDLELVGGVDIKSGSFYGVEVVESSNIDNFLKEKKPDVLIDFTVASAAVENIKAASRNGVAVIVGTTGFSEAQAEEISNAIEGKIPAVISSNFSLGVNIFWKLVREAAKQLKDYDIEVIEAHHHFKKDAPSGTARTIIDIIKEEVGERDEMYGRKGMVGERGNEIGVHVIRGGDIIGDHTVLFAGNDEVIELTHRAYDRTVFAHGVIRSASWIYNKQPGVYSMEDVMGFKE